MKEDLIKMSVKRKKKVIFSLSSFSMQPTCHLKQGFSVLYLNFRFTDSGTLYHLPSVAYHICGKQEKPLQDYKKLSLLYSHPRFKKLISKD